MFARVPSVFMFLCSPMRGHLVHTLEGVYFKGDTCFLFSPHHTHATRWRVGVLLSLRYACLSGTAITFLLDLDTTIATYLFLNELKVNVTGQVLSFTPMLMLMEYSEAAGVFLFCGVVGV